MSMGLEDSFFNLKIKILKISRENHNEEEVNAWLSADRIVSHMAQGTLKS